MRDVAVTQLRNFKDDASLPSKLSGIAATDPAYRVRRVALGSLAKIQAPNAFDVFAAAVNSDSPDDTIREASLTAFGMLGDVRAVPILMEWSAVGKPVGSRQAAIGAIAELDKTNKEITRMLISCLNEPYFDVRTAAIFALAARGDRDAIAPLEDMLQKGELTVAIGPYIELALRLLKAQPVAK